VTDTATFEDVRYDCDLCPWVNPSNRPSALGSHKRGAHGISGEQRHKRRTERVRDPRPASISVNLPGGKSDKSDPVLQAVEDRARSLVEILAAVVLMAGAPEDAVDIQNGAPQIAKAVRDLAQYEEWLRKLAAGGETSGRVMAWIGLVTTLAAVALPIMARHGALPGPIAQVFGQVAETVGTMTDAPAGDAGAPAAA
jgi:hypothetical protein